MDLPERQVALELFKLLPTQKLRSEGRVSEMTVEERLAVFETCCVVIRRAAAAGAGRRQE